MAEKNEAADWKGTITGLFTRCTKRKFRSRVDIAGLKKERRVSVGIRRSWAGGSPVLGKKTKNALRIKAAEQAPKQRRDLRIDFEGRDLGGGGRWLFRGRSESADINGGRREGGNGGFSFLTRVGYRVWGNSGFAEGGGEGRRGIER